MKHILLSNLFSSGSKRQAVFELILVLRKNYFVWVVTACALILAEVEENITEVA